MYSSKQVDEVFGLVAALEKSGNKLGCEAGLVTVDSDALFALTHEVSRLKSLEQRLLLGCHEHNHGQSSYLFLVPKGVEFGEDDFEARLEEEYEPDDGESLHVDRMDEAEIITGIESFEADK